MEIIYNFFFEIMVPWKVPESFFLKLIILFYLIRTFNVFFQIYRIKKQDSTLISIQK